MAKATIEIRTIGEDMWRATVITSTGAMFFCDYAPSDEKRGANADGSPNEAMVRSDWKSERGAFQQI